MAQKMDEGQLRERMAYVMRAMDARGLNRGTSGNVSVIATYLGRFLGFYQVGESAGFIAAVLGAIILLFVYRAVTGKRG